MRRCRASDARHLLMGLQFRLSSPASTRWVPRRSRPGATYTKSTITKITNVSNMLETILFYSLAIVAVVSALLVITRTNPIASALMLVVCFLATAGIFAMLGSVFLAVIQVLIYAGAIMVLFIFVIMLIHTEPGMLKKRMVTFGKILGAAAAGYLAIVLSLAVWRPPFVEAPTAGETFLAPATMGRALLTQYILPFEILSVILFIAIVGAVVLAKKKL